MSKSDGKEPIIYDLETDIGLEDNEDYFKRLQEEIPWISYRQALLRRTIPKLIYIYNSRHQYIPILHFLSEEIGEKLSIFIKKIDCMFHRNGNDYTMESSASPLYEMLILTFGAERQLEITYPRERRRKNYNMESGDLLYLPRSENTFLSIPRYKIKESQITLVLYFQKWGERKNYIPKTISIGSQMSVTFWTNKKEKIKRKNISIPEIREHELYMVEELNEFSFSDEDEDDF